MKELVFGGYWSPPITKEHYQWVKDSGITHLVIDAKYGAEIGKKELLDAFHLCDEVGLKAYINAGSNVIVNNDTNDYSDCESFCGYYADEPTVHQIEHLAVQQKNLKVCHWV